MNRYSLVYKIPCRRARAWPSAREQRYLVYKVFPSTKSFINLTAFYLDDD